MIAQITQITHFLLSPPSFLDVSLNSTRNPRWVSFESRCLCCSATFSRSPQVTLFGSAEAGTSSCFFASRVPRSSRAVAQDVLFDYLHCTRSLGFTDAEHISKNSPHFVERLLSKIDGEKDIARSLRKFLRYNPINEFEPFFESLGLSPSELSSFLPRHLFFLGDDHALLENFHVLCDYGIPRSNIGRIYREAREVFGYRYGLLASRLRACENLGLSKSTVIVLVSCCPSLLTSGEDSEFVKVLEKFRRVGIKKDWIGRYLAVEDTYNWKRMLETMDFLEKVGYSQDQLCKFIKRNPALLFEGSGKNYYVLFARLLKLGLKMTEVYLLFVQQPKLLSLWHAKKLLQAVDFLLDIGMGPEDIANIVSMHGDQLCSCSLKGPKTVCRELKIKKFDLCQIIREDPMMFLSLASKSKFKRSGQVVRRDPIKHREKVSFLLRLGYVENSEEMMRALKKFRGQGDQLQERFDSLVQAGLDYNVVSSLVKQAPMVLNQSKDLIQKKIDCLVNFLGYPIESIVSFPAYLCYDLDRINRRFRMYMWLKERGAAKSMLCLSTVLACSDAKFVKYFVDVHPEGPVTWECLRMQSVSS